MLALCGSLGAQVDDLTGRSPFLPPDFSPPDQQPNLPRGTPSPSMLEFRGVYAINGSYQFQIYNKAENKGTWVGIGDTGARYEVRSFDASANSIVVMLNGSPVPLTLIKPSEGGGPPAPMPMVIPTMPYNGGPPPGLPPGAMPPNMGIPRPPPGMPGGMPPGASRYQRGVIMPPPPPATEPPSSNSSEYDPVEAPSNQPIRRRMVTPPPPPPNR